jgi:hypothetical protein
VADVQRLDAQLKDSHRRIRTAVAASQTSLTEIYGMGSRTPWSQGAGVNDRRRKREHLKAADRAGIAGAGEP